MLQSTKSKSRTFVQRPCHGGAPRHMACGSNSSATRYTCTQEPMAVTPTHCGEFEPSMTFLRNTSALTRRPATSSPVHSELHSVFNVFYCLSPSVVSQGARCANQGLNASCKLQQFGGTRDWIAYTQRRYGAPTGSAAFSSNKGQNRWDYSVETRTREGASGVNCRQELWVGLLRVRSRPRHYGCPC